MIDYRDFSAAVRRAAQYAKRVANIKGPVVLDGQIPPRSNGNRIGSINVTADTALRHSAVWACITLRAGLISTFPLDVYRKISDDVRVHVTTPQILVTPGGKQWPITHWMYATQFDLDRVGNAFGIITETTQNGLPAKIVLQKAVSAQVRRSGEDGRLKYKFANDNTWYDEDKVWHERAYPVSGLDVGLSPIAYAAWSIAESLSEQDFALQWFGNGGMPKAELVNSEKKLNPKEARIIKDRYNQTVNHGDVFVHGNDWTYNMMQANKMGTEWIEGRRFSLEDIARFFGVPTDLIDATAGVGSNIKYANITQQHLKFLVLRLHSAVTFREVALSTLTAAPRFVKLNTDSILRMDPLQRAQYIGALVGQWLMTNSEARQLDDRLPLTDSQIEEMVKIYGAPKPPQTPSSDPNGAPPSDSGGGHD